MSSRIEFEAAQINRPDMVIPKRNEHVWIATAVYRLSDKEMLGKEQIHMDMENLAFTVFGCFVCEQAFETRLLYRDCPGEPDDLTPSPDR